ncbi:MAG: type II toxin-antitoxin system HicA family toxin [Moorellales bacterium]
MSKLEKLYQRIRNNPRQVRFDELRRILLRAGFKERQPRGGSSHYTYVKGNKIITIPRNDPVKPEYVKEAIKALEGELNSGN